MTTLSILFVCLIAALLELDTTYAFQFLLSRPIIAGPIFGILTGDALAGLQVGIFAELLFSDISPLGGIIPPSGVVATVIPLILYAQGIELYFGFFTGVLAAILYSWVDALLRKNRFTWMVFVEQKILRRPTDMKQAMLGSLAISVCMSFVFISAVTWLCGQLFFLLFPYFTAKIHLAFRLAYLAVPWIGLATLIPAFRFKTR